MNDNERVELNELISVLVDGRATAAEHSRLEEMLADSDEARRFYVRSMAMSASLYEYSGEMQSERPEPPNVIRVASWSRWAAPLAAAAAVLFGIWIARLFFNSDQPTTAEEQPESVARLSGSKDCKWIGAAPASGDELVRGRRLELASGFAELTFDSGAQITLTGPATLDLRSAWEAELQRGTLKANVPPEAIGFRVVNAAVEVVDLGTEFSMTAEEGGTAEVFVLKGAVEVQPRNQGGGEQPRSVLREKQARRFAKAGTSDVRDGDKKFQRFAAKIAVERMGRPLNYMRWSFDEGAGEIAGAVSNSANASAIPLGKNGETNSSDSHWTQGRWGSALQFDGQPAVQAKLSGAASMATRSVACWVRLPAEASVSGAQTFLTLPLNHPPQSWAEFSWNSLPGEGVLGALRMQTRQGAAVGTTHLRDGKWHHVAAIFGQPAKKANKAHTKLYVDGRLETFSVKPGNRRGFSETSVALDGTLWLGGQPGSSAGTMMAMDELLLVDRQLSPPEIRHLMLTNQLLSAEVLAAN
ncbi:MAG: LamG-like jellyroll fold domain-containing protein [Chthoniobacteraceae bacterium]